MRSEALGVCVTLVVAAKTLRTINKYGGLDLFLVNYGYNKLSGEGIQLKRRVEKALKASGSYDSVKVVKKSARHESLRIAKQKAKKSNG